MGRRVEARGGVSALPYPTLPEVSGKSFRCAAGRAVPPWPTSLPSRLRHALNTREQLQMRPQVAEYFSVVRRRLRCASLFRQSGFGRNRGTGEQTACLGHCGADGYGD